MKRYVTVCLSVLIMNCLVSCSSADISSPSESNSVADSESSSQTPKENTEHSDISETETEADLKDNGISIVSWSLDKDYNGNDALVIEYSWTNNDDEPKSFMLAVSDKVFQNGIEFATAIGCESMDSSMQSKDVQPGVTYNVKAAYVLQDMTMANVVIKKAFSFDDNPILNENIDLGGGESEVSQTDDLQETSVKIADYSFDVDYKGEEVLVVNYEFYNGEDKAKSFATTFTDKAFQNGIECDSLVIMGNDSKIDLNKSLNEIQPGVSCIITEAYKLSDKSDVEISVTGWISDKEYLKETIQLQ